MLFSLVFRQIGLISFSQIGQREQCRNQIRLLLEEQYYQGLHCLVQFLYWKAFICSSCELYHNIFGASKFLTSNIYDFPAVMMSSYWCGIVDR